MIPYMFSVIIPTLNEEIYLPRLLQSLVKQTNQDFEIIVSDGKSQDKTLKIVTKYQKIFKNRLTVVQNDPPSLPKQRNTGAAIAMGKYLLFIDADGELFPYALERFAVFVQSQKPAFFSPWFSPDRESVSDALLVLLMNGSLEGGILAKRPVALGQFTGIRSDVFAEVGGYDERIQWGEDNDISHRMVELGHQLSVIRETLVIYSLRRFRKQGTIRTLQVYARAAFMVLLTKKATNNIPGYIMGGHLYADGEMKESKSLLKDLQERLDKFTKELFE